MKILIVGAGRLGAQLARVLAEGANSVSIVDISERRIAELPAQLPVRRLTGDASDARVLEEAGAHNTDLLVAACDDDSDNLVIGYLGKARFGIRRVIARVNDPDNAWLFDERWGIDVAVPAETPLISLIEEATEATDTVSLLRLSKAGVNVIETSITAGSRADGHRLSELVLPAGTVVATVIREGRPSVPGRGFVLRAGDELLVVSETATKEEIRTAFH